MYDFLQKNTICKILSPKYFFGLSDLSECHFDIFGKVLRRPVYTNPLFYYYYYFFFLGGGGGYTLKSVIADPKVLPLNSYKREKNLIFFSDLCQNGFVEPMVSCQLK